MNLSDFTAKVADALPTLGFGRSVKFDFGADGVLHIDGPAGVASNENSPADATIKVSWADFQDLLSGKLNGMGAFMSGKLKVEGDMSVAMQLESLFSKLR